VVAAAHHRQEVAAVEVEEPAPAAAVVAYVREDPPQPLGRGDRRGVEEVVLQQLPPLGRLVGPQLVHEGLRDEREVQPQVVELLQVWVRWEARRRFH
jgi:hypothetical protein